MAREGHHYMQMRGLQDALASSDELAESIRKAGDDELDAVYRKKLAELVASYFTGLFKSPEVQRMIREQCRAAVQHAVGEVIERQRDQLRHDVEVFIGERWQESVEAIANATLADELGKIRARITGGRT